MLAPVLCLVFAVSAAFASDFKELSKAEVQEFSRAAKAINGAMTAGRFEQIRSFGPGILRKYASIQIQADDFAKAEVQGYFRTDSIVAYSILRITCDSLLSRIEPSPALDGMFASLSAADRVHFLIEGNPILKRFDKTYADSIQFFSEEYIERIVPSFLKEAKRLSKYERALSLVNSLSYKPGVSEDVRSDIAAGLRNAYFDAMGSNSVEALQAFAKAHPDFEPAAVAERIERIRGDEVAFLLERGSRLELLAYLTGNPDERYVQDVRDRLQPIFYRYAVGTQDLDACRQYVELFPEPAAKRHDVLDLIDFLVNEATAKAAGEGLSSAP